MNHQPPWRSATGYLLKDAPRAAADGQSVLSSSVATEATVKSHLLNIYAKLGVNDRAAAVAEAFNRGPLTPGTTEPE